MKKSEIECFQMRWSISRMRERPVRRNRLQWSWSLSISQPNRKKAPIFFSICKNAQINLRKISNHQEEIEKIKNFWTITIFHTLITKWNFIKWMKNMSSTFWRPLWPLWSCVTYFVITATTIKIASSASTR